MPAGYNLDMSTKRILIADDALDFGRMLQASLATLGTSCKVTLVPSAEEALLETRRGATDLLISDVRLPGMSGFDLVRKARERYPQLKIIVVTGLKDESMRQQAADAGADAFFTKPLTVAEFLATAETLLGIAPAAPVRPALIDPSPAQPNGNAAALLDALRARLGAKAVLLLGPAVTITATGSVADALAPEHSAALREHMAAMETIARQLGRAGGVLAFDGEHGHLLAAPVRHMALVCLFAPGASTLRMALAVEELQAAQHDLLLALGGDKAPAPFTPVETPVELPPPTPQPAEPAPEPAPLAAQVATAEPPPVLLLDNVEEDLSGLEGIFGAAKPAAATAIDLDSFWEQAAQAHSTAPRSADALSFEDARRLGLAPGEGE